MKSISDKIRAGYPGIYLTSFEEQRAEAMLKGVADSLEYSLHAWSCTTGRVDTKSGQVFGEADPTEVLAAVHSLPEKTILLLRDFHLILKDPNPMIYRMVKDALLHAKTANKTIVILSPVLELPIELSKYFVVEEFKLPDRADLLVVLENLCGSNGRPMPVNGALDAVLDASMGLSTTEAEDAFALSNIETGTFSPAVIAREKAGAVKKNGQMEIIESIVKPEDIGGLELFKADLLDKRHNFTRAARDFGLKSPRGVLVVGQAGTGKSLTAQACGNIFNIPLVKIDANALFGSLQGSTGQNWRNVFSVLKAIRPCVAWIDEGDGLFSGSKSSGMTDGGVTNRLLKDIAQDMQFHGEGIFFIFTANDLDGFPDYLVDRLDVWGVDLPTQTERESIWNIHIAKIERDPKAFDITALARTTEGFSGRQIEQVVAKALCLAYSPDEPGRDLTNADCLTAAASFTATSVTMAAVIEARRNRLAGKVNAASLPEITVLKPVSNSRKLAA